LPDPPISQKMSLHCLDLSWYFSL